MSTWRTIEELCDRYLQAMPSPKALAQLKKVERQPESVSAMVERAFRLMGRAHFRAADISPLLAFAMGVVVPGMDPGSWGGSVPSWTWPLRHKRIDQYIDSNPWFRPGPGTAFLDIGCGFPPQTATDVARAHPEWQVRGADPGFDEYILYGEDGNYACITGDGRVRYFHGGDAAKTFALYQDRKATLQRFSGQFEQLSPMLPPSPDGETVEVTDGGVRLVRHPLKLFESANLHLIRAGIGDEFPLADIIRCFNVLVYFGTAFRRDADAWALRTLKPGGVFVTGGDNVLTLEARYSIYRHEGGLLVPKEFAFSVDNVQGLSAIPWCCGEEGERETWALIEAIGIVRGEGDFLAEFTCRSDALLEEHRLFDRDSSGWLVPAANQVPQADWAAAREAIATSLEREGFAERAAAVLRKHRLRAWVNEIGHVAVDPNDLSTFRHP